MIDLRPVAHPIGKIIVTLGVSMLAPMLVDWWHGDPHWVVFLQCAALTAKARAPSSESVASRPDPPAPAKLAL